ncbi:MAG: hypothetical protein GY795_09265 [Desulfobacterales bacterium]|nr:hypothetical protein [Desulfobacterales bacterium]
MPAHAFDIYHPFPYIDYFEHYAFEYYIENSVDIFHTDNSYPYDYMDNLRNNTKDIINNDREPPPQQRKWNDYWIEKSCKAGYKGCYGVNDKDIFPNFFAAQEEKNLVRNQYNLACNYGAGALLAASKKLPPLIKELEIISDCVYSYAETPLIDTHKDVEIKIEILENRKKAVKIFITVDDEKGPPIISSEYGTGKPFELSESSFWTWGETLPWEGTLTVNWNGKLANGKELTGGHTLYVRVQDEDENDIWKLQPFIIIDKCNECKDGEIEPKCEPKKDCTVSCDSETGECDYDCDTDNSDPTYIQHSCQNDPPVNEKFYQFSPNTSPQREDTLDIDYKIEKPSLVSTLIYDANGNLITTLNNNVLREAGDKKQVWDGRDDEGEPVSDGMYYFVINGVNVHDALDTWEISDEITIDDTLPTAKINFIKAHTPQYGHYSLIGTATDDHFEICYVEWLKDDTHEDINYIYSPVQNGELATFDATALEDGQYTVRLTVKDHAGNSTTDEIPLVIDRTFNGLKVHINSVSPNVIPGSDGYLPTSDDTNIWIDDALPQGSTEIETWEWDTNITYSGLKSHTDPANTGTHGHYFIHADNPLSLTQNENIIQYVYLDPANPPDQILLQFYTDQGNGEHRAYWGANNIPTGGESGTASLYSMGSLPPTGKWVRLKIPASVVGLSGKEVKGVAFVTYNGKAYWDKTTKSSDYNETQENSWMPASQIESEDKGEGTVNYSVSQNSTLNLAIYDKDNNLVKNLLTNEFKAAGTHNINWDSTDNAGNPVPEGRYYFQFTSPDGPIDSNAYGIMPGDWSSQAVSLSTTITDSTGNQYEINASVVNKYNTANELVLTITADMLGVNTLNPTALGIDINDNLFIADNTQSKIFKVNANGYYLIELPYLPDTPWAASNMEIEQPNGIILDSNGDMLIQNRNGTETIKLAVGRGVIDLSTIIAEIRVPYENSLISYSVPIIGTAAAKDFDKYTVEYGAGESPTEWTTLVTSGTEVFDDKKPLPPSRTVYGNLATWHTAQKVSTASGNEDYYIPMGVYTIRLTVFNQNGEFKDDTIKVEMAHVVFRYHGGGTVTSSDGRVIFNLSGNAIPDDAELFSVRPAVEPPPVTDPGITPVSEIYEVKPAGYQFLKPCTLTLYYTDAELGSIDENTLNIFKWNPITQKWVYADANPDTANNMLTTEVSGFNEYEVYYAVMSYSLSAPVIYQPDSPTPLKTISVYGEATPPGGYVEIFVNSTSQGKVRVNEDTGYFVKPVQLNTGDNQITAKTVDSSGNTSSASNPVSVQVVLNQPSEIESVSFKTGDFSSDFTDDATIGDSLYIEVIGTDADPTSVDSTLVTIKSSQTDSSTGISVQLLETAPNSGVYRGTAKVSETSDISTASIGVSAAVAETITVISDADTSKQDSLNTRDTLPPPAPIIASLTHPSLCQNTFEADTDESDEWENMSSNYGATVTKSDETALSGNYSVKLMNTEQGGDFANYIRSTRFDARQYPIVSFDYKIPSNLKVNMVAYVNSMWKEIIFTDDPKTVETFEQDLYRTIGTVENVQADNSWHNAEFNLYNMLKNDDPDQDEYIVEELFFADYDLTGWMELVMGEENPEGTTYYIDNFIITEGGKSDNNPVFAIIPNDSGVIEYSYILDQYPYTIPDEVSEGSDNPITMNNVDDGIWYFHARSLDGGGNWGPANHYQIKVDTTGPTVTVNQDIGSPEPFEGKDWGKMEIKIQITDGNGSGVNPDTIKIRINDVTYDMASKGISYDEESGFMTFSLWKAEPEQDPWQNGSTIQATLISADDFAGNPVQEFSWTWTVDYSELAGGSLSLLTTQGGYSPSWSYDGTKIVFMSERSGNKDIWVTDADNFAEADENAVRQLTTNEADDHHPAWSPNDNQIAFVSDRDSFDHIYLINADGTGLTQLTTGDTDDSHPTWFPDGTQIAFSRNGDIWTINGDGTNEKQITDAIEYCLDPVWSPDGTQIAFTRTLYVDEVAVINADGTNQTVLTDSNFDMLPAWTRQTGQVIFVTERDEKTRAIQIVSSSGTNEGSFIDNENEWWDSEPEQSPMNDNIAFQSTRNGTWNIWVKTYLEITNVEASPESFSPNDDGIHDTTGISFGLSGGSAQTDLIIYDSSDNPVAVLLENELVEIGENTFTWDGTDTEGNIVADGTYTYKLIIKGSTEEESIEKTGTVTVDTSPPSFDEWTLPDITGDSVDISVNISDASDITTAKLQYGIASTENEIFPDIISWTDFGSDSGTGTSGTLDLNWPDYDGNYLYIRAYSEDEHGNVIYSEIQKKLIGDGTSCDAVAKFIITTDELTAYFDTTGSTGEIFSFDYGDGNTGTDPAYTYANADTYEVTLTVTDTVSNCSTATSKLLTMPCNAVAAFTAEPVTGDAPLTVNFDASGSTGHNYEWDFGNCSENSTGQTTNYLYDYAGIFKAGLTVTSNGGCSDTQETEITVYGEYALGNADGIGCVNIFDALAVARYDVGLLSEEELPGFAVADVDGDGSVDIMDALRIAEYSVGLTDDLNHNGDMLVLIFGK